MIDNSGLIELRIARGILQMGDNGSVSRKVAKSAKKNIIILQGQLQAIYDPLNSIPSMLS